MAIVVLFTCTTAFGIEANNYTDAYNKMVNDNKPGIIVMSATWCIPCGKLKQEIKPLLPKLHKYYVVYMLDVDEEKDIAIQFKKMKLWRGSVPAIIIVNHGAKKAIAYKEGFLTKSQFINWHNGVVKEFFTRKK
jgi:thioredoxin-related protein